MADVYEYENGEEYYGKDNQEFADRADMAFELIDKTLSDETPVSWDVMCSYFFDLDIPDRRDPAWVQHVGARNAMKQAVNHRASIYNRPWRLYISTHGETLVKKSGRQMVETELSGRVRGVSRSYQRLEDNLRPMISIPGLSRRDKMLLERAVDMNTGARVATIGLISQMQSVPKKMKRQLLSEFDLGLDEAEDELGA